jgi:hypothetical protein
MSEKHLSPLATRLRQERLKREQEEAEAAAEREREEWMAKAAPQLARTALEALLETIEVTNAECRAEGSTHSFAFTKHSNVWSWGRLEAGSIAHKRSASDLSQTTIIFKSDGSAGLHQSSPRGIRRSQHIIEDLGREHWAWILDKIYESDMG